MQLVNPLLPCKELDIEFIPALVTSWMCPVGSSNNELAIDRVRRNLGDPFKPKDDTALVTSSDDGG
jgi:hypothetical protein